MRVGLREGGETDKPERVVDSALLPVQNASRVQTGRGVPPHGRPGKSVGS